MKAKEYLQQLELLDIKINQKKMRVAELRLFASNISTAVDNERVQTSCPGDKLSNTIIKCIDLENEIKVEIHRFMDRKTEIVNQIQALNNSKYIQILFMRYVQYKKLKMIAVELNYSYQYTRELHRCALKEFERTYTNLHRNVI